MRPWGVLALVLGGLCAAGRADARGRDDDADDEADATDDDRGDDADDRDPDDDRDSDDDADDRDSGDDDDDDGVRANKGKASASDDDGDAGSSEEDFERAKDHTRPGGGRADQNSFLRERFFVDKVDSKKTSRGTLVQGSLTSSSFYYTESGGALGGQAGTLGVTSDSQFSRMFTDLRAQLDALHLGGTRWDFRLDGRIRFVNDPGQATTSIDGVNFPTRVQSGLFGRNEYDLRELWLVRGGDRADIFFGRQYIADLGAIKIDGLRLDYAYSPRFTVIAFGGAYPYRGSRSVGLDYIDGKDAAGKNLGRIIPIAAGGGAAYRTEHTYGSFGGVAIVPLKGEQPRIYATSSGYWRTGPKLDFYHFAILDLYGTEDLALTNLSAGVNFRPAPRIRANAAVNRVDTETLTVQAQSFLANPDPGVIRNDTTIQRVASDQARGGLSVSLGQTQQIEVSTSLTYRRRPSISLSDGQMVLQTLDASSSVEVLFQVLHRNLRGMRIGLDGSRIFKVGGGASYARSASFSGRLYVGREFRQGRGEWQAEAAYTTARDQDIGTTCNIGALETCYGTSKIGLLELGGTVYYRLRDSLFAVGMLNLGRYASQAIDPTMGAGVTDANVTSASGYLRLAYRF